MLHEIESKNVQTTDRLLHQVHVLFGAASKSVHQFSFRFKVLQYTQRELHIRIQRLFCRVCGVLLYRIAAVRDDWNQ